MKQTDGNQSVMDRFMCPVEEALKGTKQRRECPGLSDCKWLQMGVERSLKEERSGRSFLQDWAMSREGSESVVAVSHFFETLKSERRLKLVKEVNTLVASRMGSHPSSLLDELKELDRVDVYAGDGHYHGASVHDRAIEGKRRAVGHFYTLNLRTHGLTHLTSADLQGGRKKAEHDMHALKRLSPERLRQGAPKGRQVLYVWDCAGIDMQQWHHWKQSSGIYFLSRAKDLFKITCYGSVGFDRHDPVNRGVLADEYAATGGGGAMIRYIRYRCPHTQTEYAFITNHMKIRPGVLAWLYMRRWDIEKTYDTFKNKLGEKKAWAGSRTAKTMQAQLLCLAHNLMVLLESELSSNQRIKNEKEIARCQKRNQRVHQQCKAMGQERSPLYDNPHKRSQLALKFIRWLRYHLQANSLLIDAMLSLRRVYAWF